MKASEGTPIAQQDPFIFDRPREDALWPGSDRESSHVAPPRRRVRDVMSRGPASVSASTPIDDAARAMREAHVGSLVVTGEDGRPRGVVTDRDIMLHVVADGEPSTGAIGDIVSGPLITVRADQPLEEAADTMSEHRVSRVAVLDGDRPVGLLSSADLRG
jgi:CBS domain-containing protein